MANTNDQLKFVLFTNKGKKTEKHPDYQGSVEKDGKKYPISAWVHEDKNGAKYVSGKIDFNNEIKEKLVESKTL